MTSLKELVEYIQNGVGRGHTIESLKRALLKQGVRIARIDEAIDEHTKLKKLNRWLLLHPFLKYWDPVIAYFALIAILSFMPSPPSPEALLGLEGVITNNMKHFGLYFGFSLVLGMASRHSRYWFLRLNHYLFAIVVSISIGMADEINQLFVPGRYGDLMDVFYDSLGAIGAQVFRYVWRHMAEIVRKKM